MRCHLSSACRSLLMCLLVLLKGKFLCLFLVLVLCRVLVLWPGTLLVPCTLAWYFCRGRDLGGLLRHNASDVRCEGGVAACALGERGFSYFILDKNVFYHVRVESNVFFRFGWCRMYFNSQRVTSASELDVLGWFDWINRLFDYHCLVQTRPRRRQ